MQQFRQICRFVIFASWLLLANICLQDFAAPAAAEHENWNTQTKGEWQWCANIQIGLFFYDFFKYPGYEKLVGNKIYAGVIQRKCGIVVWGGLKRDDLLQNYQKIMEKQRFAFLRVKIQGP